jgi:Zn-dependent M28 family amino/carboxypeptidase
MRFSFCVTRHTLTLLCSARQIYAQGVTFQKNVQICAFAGEEQGLLGSRAHARQWPRCPAA